MLCRGSPSPAAGTLLGDSTAAIAPPSLDLACASAPPRPARLLRRARRGPWAPDAHESEFLLGENPSPLSAWQRDEVIPARVVELGRLRAHTEQRGHRALARRLQVGHDPVGVSDTELDPSRGEHRLRRPPWGMDVLRTRLRRQHKVPLVDSGPAGILPHHGVDGVVGVHEGIVKPASPLDPADAEELDQEGGGHHADRLVHPPRRPQAAHPCVHHGVAGAPALPRPERRGVARPAVRLIVCADGLPGHLWESMQLEVGQVAPVQATREGFDLVARKAGVAHRMEELARRQLPKAEVGARPATLVASQPDAVDEQEHETNGFRLARGPALHHRRAPVPSDASIGAHPRRSKPETYHGCRLRPLARRGQASGRAGGARWQRARALACFEKGHQRTPVAAAPAGRQVHLVRLVEQMARHVFHGNACAAQCGRNDAFHPPALRLIAPVPVDGPRATLSRQQKHFCCGQDCL
eukprot:scaffold5115_cov113-Isochrysis_galbana.AAC.8